MPLFPLNLQPGVRKGGTDAKSAGSYSDSQLVRWTPEGDLKPWRGWRKRIVGAVSGVPRAIAAWKDNAKVARFAIGTHTKIYVLALDGTLTDVTPLDYTAGQADTALNVGYGGGLYGQGVYGGARQIVSTPVEASVVQFAAWGENMLSCSTSDGRVLEYEPDDTVMAPVSGAPEDNRGILVIEFILMVLGADSNPRNVTWSDQGDNTEWTPDLTTQAGDKDLQTPGKIMCGAVLGRQAVILTDIDAHVATYEGGTYVFRWDELGDGCGAISQNCAAALKDRVVWMSNGGFWMFNQGYLLPLDCTVIDEVFSDLNTSQVAKVAVMVDSTNGVVRWHYPSATSTENDAYVEYDYIQNLWSLGRLARTGGCDTLGRGFYPMAVSPDGYIYEHEIGWNYDGLVPRARSGPISVGQGDNIILLESYVPDERTLGEAEVTFYFRDRQTETPVPYGPHTADSRTDLRACGRILEVEYAFTAQADSRIGIPQLGVKAGGRR